MRTALVLVLALLPLARAAQPGAGPVTVRLSHEVDTQNAQLVLSGPVGNCTVAQGTAKIRIKPPVAGIGDGQTHPFTCKDKALSMRIPLDKSRIQAANGVEISFEVPQLNSRFDVIFDVSPPPPGAGAPPIPKEAVNPGILERTYTYLGTLTNFELLGVLLLAIITFLALVALAWSGASLLFERYREFDASAPGTEVAPKPLSAFDPPAVDVQLPRYFDDSVQRAAASAARALNEVTALRNDFALSQQRLDDTLSELRRNVGSLGSPTEVLYLERLLRPGGVPSVDRFACPTKATEEQMLLAAVNYWLDLGSPDRSELLALAAKLGLQVRFFIHRDASKVLQDLTNFVYPFEPSEKEGGWLWVDLPGTTQSITVPADASLFRMGKAPDLVARLFDGMRNQDGFRFRRFYRACRLQPASGGDGYEVAQKGLLLLDGDPDPRLPVGPDYQSLAPASSGFETAAPGVSLAAGLRVYLSEMSRTMAAQREEIAGLRASVAELRERVAGAPRAPSVAVLDAKTRREIEEKFAQDLDQRIAAVRAELQEANMAAEMVRMRQRITAKIAAAAPRVQAPVAGPPAPLVPMLPETSVVQSAVPAPAEAEPAVPALAAPVLAAAAPEVPVPAPPAPEPPPARVEAPPLVRSPRPAPPPRLAARRGFRLPEAWKQSLVGAEALPAESGMLTKQEYIRRISALRLRLAQLPDAEPVRIVHLQHTEGAFNIHDVEETPEGMEEMFCKGCQGNQSWQLAVSVGEPNGDIIALLFGLGPLALSNYPTGYRSLIEDVPGTVFTISQVRQPAMLRKSGAGLYSVTQKMAWS